MAKAVGIGLLAAAMAAATVAASPPPGAARADAAGPMEQERLAEQNRYDKLMQDITISQQRMAALTADIASMKKDRATITAALIEAARTERKYSQDIDDIEGRLTKLRGRQDDVRKSLAARRGVLGDVLGGLERMGLNPPPALLVKPRDALSSVRSAILLGAVVPELRGQTEILVGDLKELSRVAASIETARQSLIAKAKDEKAERARLGLLLDEKAKLESQSESKLAAEQRKAAELASKAKNVKDLIAGLEAQIAAARQAAEAARKAEHEREKKAAARANLPIPKANRLGMASFASMRGRMQLPVIGVVARRFGEGDGVGGTMQGDMVKTQSGAIVTTPTNGTVLYAGTFRSYGQLLILDAGDGYHMILAGMDRISVSLGQSVLAGEPVGMMGDARVASAVPFGDADAGPELYVEFRKDGKPVDPDPWWAERVSGRTGNDS